MKLSSKLELIKSRNHLAKEIPSSKTIQNDYNILYSKRYVQSFAKQSLKYILNKTTFSKIPIICPPIELQNEFADFVTQIETIKLNQFKSKEAIIELFNITLKKSFKGMIQC